MPVPKATSRATATAGPGATDQARGGRKAVAGLVGGLEGHSVAAHCISRN